ncbi:MAG TPA: S41 family peptidase [Rhizomicrobium sp.]|nr:S41 family peptidase [Rhizomicrobium sp.]
MKKSALISILMMSGIVTGCGGLPQLTGTTPAKDAAPVAAVAPAPAIAPAPGQLSLLQQAMARVRASYVRPVEDSELIDGALQGMVSGLDPHSNYLNAKTYSNMLTATKGQFGGVGLVMEPVDGLIKVISAKDGAPAAKAGIKPEDRIAAIDGASVDGADFNEAIDKMRGPAGSNITLTILREGEKKPLEVTMQRAIVAVDAVTWRREGDIGYVRVPGFNEKTGAGFEKAVLDLKKQIGPGLKGYVLDLRNNPGGLVDQAVRVSDDLLDSGEIVSIRGRSEQNVQRYTAREGDITEGKPVVVLINAGTASASEIVSGALQDNKRATIIGMRSFGKGSVQSNIPLGAGLGALHLTTGRYFTPSGRSIQAQGIDPDLPVAQGDETVASKEADLRRHLLGDAAAGGQAARPVIKADPGKSYADFQLSYAEDLLHGKTATGSAAVPSMNKPATR